MKTKTYAPATGAGHDLQVLVAQGVVAQQVRLALRPCWENRWKPGSVTPWSIPASTRRTSTTTSPPAHATTGPGLDKLLASTPERRRARRLELDRLGRNLAHLVNTVQDLSARGVGLRVLAGQGAQIDTTTAAGRLVSGIFAALAEFERELIRERTRAGLQVAKWARGRKGGRRFALSKAQVRLAQAAMAHRDRSVSALCRELGISPVTLYRYVGPQGQLRQQGRKVLAS